MAKTKGRAASNKTELDGVYLLKMVVYLVLGSVWIRLSFSGQNWQIPIPIGFIFGIFLAMKEKFQIDRKLEYSILLMAMFIGFWLPLGVNITI